MTKTSLIRLPDVVGEEIEKIAKRKGLPFAAMVRCLLIECLNERYPAVQPSTAQTTGSQ